MINEGHNETSRFSFATKASANTKIAGKPESTDEFVQIQNAIDDYTYTESKLKNKVKFQLFQLE